MEKVVLTTFIEGKHKWIYEYAKEMSGVLFLNKIQPSKFRGP